MLRLIAAAVVTLLSTAANASLVTIQFSYNISNVRDLVTGQYQDIAPMTGIGSFTFDVDDYAGNTSSTSLDQWFGLSAGLEWTSPTTALLPYAWDSGYYGPVWESSVLIRLSIGHDFCYCQIKATNEAQAWDAESYISRRYWLTLASQIPGRSPNADGSALSLYSRDELLTYYRGLMADRVPVAFSEGYSIFSLRALGYLEGIEWYSDARIVSVIEHDAESAVPEPASVYLLIVAMVPFLRSRQRTQIIAQRPTTSH